MSDDELGHDDTMLTVDLPAELSPETDSELARLLLTLAFLARRFDLELAIDLPAQSEPDLEARAERALELQAWLAEATGAATTEVTFIASGAPPAASAMRPRPRAPRRQGSHRRATAMRRLILLVIGLLSVIGAPAAAADATTESLVAREPSNLPTLGLRTGQHEAFRRAVIEPIDPTSTSVVREPGRVIVSLPGSLSATDLERLSALPGVEAAKMVGAQLVVDLAEGAGTRDLIVEPDKQVLDIYPAGLPGSDPLADTDPLPGTDPATAPAAPPTTKASRETAPGPTEAESAATETAPASLTPTSTGEQPDTTVDQPDEPMATHSAPATAWPHFSELAIDSVASADGAVELRFGWPDAIPAAVFIRGAQLWIAFAATSDKIAVDTAAFSRSAGRFAGAIRQEPHPEATILRLSLSRQPAIEVGRDGNDWRVILTPGAAPRSKSGPETTIEASDGGILLPHVGQAVSITDPVVGDRLGIGFATRVGAVTQVPARYVGARFLAADQGAAWEQLMDTGTTGKPAARGLWLGPADGVVTGPYDRARRPITAAMDAESGGRDRGR